MAIFRAAFGPTSSVSEPNHWIFRALGMSRTHAGVAVSEYTAINYPAVYACLNRISNPIARFPARIYRPKKERGFEEVTDHPLSRRLSLRPNDFMSARTLRKTVQCHALTWGNGYCEIERNERGQAIALWPLLPWNTYPEKLGGGALQYKTTIDGRQFTIAADDVIHIMDLSQDGYRGRSQIAVAREAIAMGLAMEQFGGKFFANDAKSGGFLMHPGRLGKDAKANLEKSFHKTEERDDGRGREGLDRAHRVKVLEEGMKFVETTIPPEDAQFLGSREFQIAEIARMYDVPLVMLQSHEKTTSWGTGIENLMIAFVRQTLEPWVHAWEQEYNWKIFTEEERNAGYYVQHNLNVLLRGDSAARAQFYQTMFGVGAFTANRICELEGEEPFAEGGDERFVPSNYVPISRALAPPAPAPDTTPPARLIENPGVTQQ